MQIIDNTFSGLLPDKELSKYAPTDGILYIDIETTGLAKENTSLYLIGCGYYGKDAFNTRLFFADESSEELMILEEFVEFSKNYTHLVHFNGTKFDIPYLEYKAKKYGLKDIFSGFKQVDVYQLSKPLRNLLFPQSMRQKCIEDFLGITRNDLYNGGELISVYHSYVESRNEDDFSKLITHNLEDVLGMHKIIPILNYLNFKDCELSLTDVKENRYTDYEGKSKSELLLTYKTDVYFPISFCSKTETLYLKADANTGNLVFRLPLYDTEMKHFFDNYRDYYYLPDEDMCIYKSAAMGLNKGRYIKASRENCCIKRSGLFVKQPAKIFTPVFKSNYKDKACYFLYPDSFAESGRNAFGKELLMVFFRKRISRS